MQKSQLWRKSGDAVSCQLVEQELAVTLETPSCPTLHQHSFDPGNYKNCFFNDETHNVNWGRSVVSTSDHMRTNSQIVVSLPSAFFVGMQIGLPPRHDRQFHDRTVYQLDVTARIFEFPAC